MKELNLVALATLLILVALSSSQTFAQAPCGTVITTDTTLTVDITSTGTCLAVGAHNIVIDGNGNRITGDGTGSGINSSGFDNVTVKNFADITNFAAGVSIGDSSNWNITNNTMNLVVGGGSFGDVVGVFFADESSSNTFANNSITISPAAIFGVGLGTSNASDNNLFVNNSVISNSAVSAIGFLFTSFGNTVRNNTLINNGLTPQAAFGILFDSEINLTVQNNTFRTFGVASAPVLLQNVLNASILDNSITSFGQTATGILSFGGISNSSIIRNNTVFTFGGNASAGVALFPGFGSNIIENNTIFTIGNISPGISIQGNNTLIRNNFINTSGNFSNGIYTDTNFTTIFNNTVQTSGNNNSRGILAQPTDVLLYINIYNNTVTTFGNDSSHGISAVQCVSCNLTNNTVRVSGEVVSLDTTRSNLSIVEGNVVFASNFSNAGVVADEGHSTQVLRNFINVTGDNFAAIRAANFTNLHITNNTLLLWDSGIDSVTGIDLTERSKNVNISFNNISVNQSFDINFNNVTNIILHNQSIANYTITFANFTVENLFGRVAFFGSVSLNGNNLSNNVTVKENNITVDSPNTPGLNDSANLTFYNIQTSGPGTFPLRDNVFCPQTICTTLQSARTFIFNVTQFSNYSLRHGCGIINDSITLTQNITAQGTCFSVNNSNLVIDGAGFALTGPGNGAGVNSTIGADNITIRNFLNISGFPVAVGAEGMDNSLIDNNSFMTNGSQDPGINLSTSNGTTISNNVVRSNRSTAIVLVDSNNSFVTQNTVFSENSPAVGVSGNNNTVSQNSLSNINGNIYSLFFDNATNSTAAENDVMGPLGILASRGGFNLIYQHNIFNPAVSLVLFNTSNNTVRDNVFSSNNSLILSNAHNSTLSNNTFNGTLVSAGFIASSNNSFNNNTLLTNNFWVSFVSAGFSNNFTNTLFKTIQGSIRIPLNFTLPSLQNISTTTLNVSFNRASLNSTTLPFLNQSGVVTLFNTNSLGLSNRFPFLNGAACPLSICTELQDDDTYIFSTTQFSDYSAGPSSNVQGGGSASNNQYSVNNPRTILRSGGGGAGSSSTSTAAAVAAAQAVSQAKLPPIQFPDSSCIGDSCKAKCVGDNCNKETVSVVEKEETSLVEPVEEAQDSTTSSTSLYLLLAALIFILCSAFAAVKTVRKVKPVQITLKKQKPKPKLWDRLFTSKTGSKKEVQVETKVEPEKDSLDFSLDKLKETTKMLDKISLKKVKRK